VSQREHVVSNRHASAVEEAHRWFVGLGDQFLAREPGSPTDAGARWRVRSRYGELIISVDNAFPYSRPTVRLAQYDSAVAQPHTESNGKLCLGQAINPRDPSEAVRLAIVDALELLKGNLKGANDVDFQDDFGLYWNQDLAKPQCGLLVSDYSRSGFGVWCAVDKAYYLFDRDEIAATWLKNRFGVGAKGGRAGVISLDRLPNPDWYPSTGADLWNLVEARSLTGTTILRDLLQNVPKLVLVALTGTAPNGRTHGAVVELRRPLDKNGELMHRKHMIGDLHAYHNPEAVCRLYTVRRRLTRRLDSAKTRLPTNGQADVLSTKRIAIVGCGALGSGVAALLAKSGIGKLLLIDDEIVGWENIRRHELGSLHVDDLKAETLARSISVSIPDVREVSAVNKTVQQAMRDDPKLFSRCDVVISCTGDWGADCALEDACVERGEPFSLVVGWVEPQAVAAHAVLIRDEGPKFRDGFDQWGNFQFPASESPVTWAASCGASTSPFGAIELSHAQALVARLVIDVLRGQAPAGEFRSWLTDARSLAELGGRWREEWTARYGAPSEASSTLVAKWEFA